MLYSLPTLSPVHSNPALPRRSSLGDLINQSTILLMLCIGALILVLALLILFHQNANATKGYMLRTLERERSQLLLDEEVLKMQLAQEQSLAILDGDHQIEAMAQPKKVLYTKEETTVATR